jgi:uncharacterized protein YkwD
VRLRALLGIAIVVLAGCSSADPSESIVNSVPAQLGSPDDFAHTLFDLVNAQRESAGVAPLEWSDCLADEAQPRAEHVLGEDILSHEPLAATCTERVKAGENLSRTWRSADEVVGLWMDSAGHKQNILDPDFVTSGIACVPYSYADPSVVAQGDDPVGGMACSQLFEGAAN